MECTIPHEASLQMYVSGYLFGNYLYVLCDPVVEIYTAIGAPGQGYFNKAKRRSSKRRTIAQLTCINPKLRRLLFSSFLCYFAVLCTALGALFASSIRIWNRHYIILDAS